MNVLGGNGHNKGLSNFRIIPNLAQGRPVLSPPILDPETGEVLFKGRPTVTIVVTDPEQWATGMKFAGDAAKAIGISKNTLNIESLRSERTSVLFQVQVPIAPNGTLAWKFVDGWTAEAKRRNPDSGFGAE